MQSFDQQRRGAAKEDDHMTIHDRIRDGLSLAKVYADDGAFRTAAARLRRLADELDRHANWADELDKLTVDGFRDADVVIAEMRDRHVETDAERCDRIGAAEYREARGE
ncbi:hypothetical protein [uncultured Hyphomicrobium sp.]|uniref:hypothetical protein n=1 Tax=uncultured Hyphomicrobium sp. TaxID=194373 RepID=UPI0025F4D11D|nr:hypothetical protein [uncultured Hyphomicrobium sp.]